MAFDWGMAAVLGLTSVLTVALTLFAVPRLPAPRSRGLLADGGAVQGADMVFLFDGEILLDATPEARRFLDNGPEGMLDWPRLAALLSQRFPGFSQAMARLPETGLAELDDRDGRPGLCARFSRGVTRITLLRPDAPRRGPIDGPSLSALQEELEILRRVVAHMPSLAWTQDAAGTVTWANRAYLSQVEQRLPEGAELTWPLPQLFQSDPLTVGVNEMAPHRVVIETPGKPAQWYDCTAVPRPGGPLYFAQPANAAVQAETSLRNFRQTLTKTFADLPIGLAIFNRARELVLFNPALTDLCALEPQFLTARPTLTAFLDRLRDRRMMPEPKDYKDWRQRMTALEEEVATGTYHETWTLPTGQTYRVSGRPHPDGALAFLFEDISAEISLTRRFRSELELGQAVIDGLDEAIAVFSPAGVLTLSNEAYARLWGIDPSVTLCEIGIAEASEHWQAACRPSPVWAQARDFVRRFGPRTASRHPVTLHDGGGLICRMQPLAGGATLIGFAAPVAVPALSVTPP
ncbi:PAS-domain containing protein [Actibacterium sp. MT2.3-13A]|uniref:PAS-domain containing protein n=1 Tax=Actibacterium sp. MT2.3-13A TaxID=2828332 RepID=UPI001BA86EAF|nr:PAS-domain containing protein [Actibacterium sp. MT2.3-13A]